MMVWEVFMPCSRMATRVKTSIMGKEERPEDTSGPPFRATVQGAAGREERRSEIRLVRKGKTRKNQRTEPKE